MAFAIRDHRVGVVPRHVVSVGHGDATVLLHILRGRFFRLNQVGGAIWNLVCQGASESAIADKIASDFEISAADAAPHVRDLVARLRDADLLAS